MPRRLLISWKVARGRRVWHLTPRGLDTDAVLCGAAVPGASPRPDLYKLEMTFSPVPAARPPEMCDRCWPIGAAQPAAPVASTHPIEDEPLAEAVRNALQRLALLPTAETLEQSDAILTDVKQRLTRALKREAIHA